MKTKLIAAIFFLIVAVWLFSEGWLGKRGLGQVRHMIKQYYQVVTQANQIQEKNITVQKEIKKLKEDKTWLEKEVREKLGWVKSNEVMYKFKNVENSGNTQ